MGSTYLEDLLYPKYAYNSAGNTSAPAPVTKAQVQASVTRTFYVIDRQHSAPYCGSRTNTGYPWQKTVDTAEQFATINEAARQLARMPIEHEGGYAKIVRVDRTTVPGTVTPAKTERRLVREGDIFPSSAKYAFESIDQFLCISDDTNGGVRWKTPIEFATLFDTEPKALHAFQRAAIRMTGTTGAAPRLVRIIETITPASTTPATTKDTLTVLA